MNSRRVLITGASRGIGRSIALRLARDGFAVTVHCRSGLDEAHAVANEIVALNRSATVLQFDVCDRESSQAELESDIEKNGAYYGIVCNAGVSRDAAFPALSDEDWDQVLAVHLGGTFRLTRACLPHFRASSYGRVINLTSYAGLHGNPGQANYATAKAGIIGFTKTVAKELAGFGVTVNAVSPNAATRLLDGIPPERRAEILRMIPAGRFADPAEICSAVGFLASAEAAYVTGIVLPVDGGLAI